MMVVVVEKWRGDSLTSAGWGEGGVSLTSTGWGEWGEAKRVRDEGGKLICYVVT